MILKLFPYVCYSVAFAFVMSFVVTIPLIGPLILIPFHAPLSLYDRLFVGDFLTTGGQVEIGFAWLTLNSGEAWFFFSSFFFFVGLFVTVLKLISLLFPRLNNREFFVTMIIICVFLLPILISLISLRHLLPLAS